MAQDSLPCFKAYDIRGKVPQELNGELARKIGRAFSAEFNLQKVVVGRDIRLSSNELADGLIEGLRDNGTDVWDLGLCGTEEIYHGAFSLEDEGVDGGVIVTASHNPADYNGMKFVVAGARPVTDASGLGSMAKKIIENDLPAPSAARGSLKIVDNKEKYVQHLLQYLDLESLRPLKIVVNSGNGCAGNIVDRLESFCPLPSCG